MESNWDLVVKDILTTLPVKLGFHKIANRSVSVGLQLPILKSTVSINSLLTFELLIG